MATVYHESNLSEATQDVHRALASLQEELEATDWYNQRMDVASDQQLKDILEHNRNEEIEHASMLLEWLRRRMPSFDENLNTYLNTRKPIHEIEEGAEESEEGESGNKSKDLGIGNLR
jgi:ferritin-like protein